MENKLSEMFDRTIAVAATIDQVRAVESASVDFQNALVRDGSGEQVITGSSSSNKSEAGVVLQALEGMELVFVIVSDPENLDTVETDLKKAGLETERNQHLTQVI